MLVGHLAMAMGAKRAAPRAPLWALVAASFGLDYLWPVLLLTGAETVRVDPGNTVFTPWIERHRRTVTVQVPTVRNTGPPGA